MNADPAGRTTVVVATRDRRSDLERSLAHHEAPVIVVDNGSSDGTVEAVRRWPGADVVALGVNRGATARNVGVARARTSYVAFADDDSWWAPGALARAADVLDAHPRLGLLAALVLVGASEVPDPVCAQMASAPLGTSTDLPGPSVLGFLACGAVVRRSAFLAAGGFDEVVFFYGEEERLALDLAASGWGLAYVDSVTAIHCPSPARDPDARRALATRNSVLTACLRRPWRVVGRRILGAARGGPVARAGLAAAVPRLPRALAARRRLPGHVEAARRLLDHSSPAE